MYYLDSNTCIYFLNGRYESVREHIYSIPPYNIRIPVIVKAELLAGAYRSAARERTLKKLLAFLSEFQIEPFTDETTEAYAQIRSDLEKKGTPIGPNDMLIAAIALSNQGILVTHNTKEFKRVKGLQLADWATT